MSTGVQPGYLMRSASIVDQPRVRRANRLILDTEASVLPVTGPGYSARANPTNLCIDGCFEDIKPNLSREHDGLGRLVRDFSRWQPLRKVR